MKSFCMVCRRKRNPIIKVRVENRNFYLCMRHALMLREALDDQLKAINHLRTLRAWAERRLLRSDEV